MKVAVIFVLLFATVLCRPAKPSSSSSESSEEVAKPAPALRKAPEALTETTPLQIVTAAASDDSSESSDEDEGSDTTSDTTSDTASVDSTDSDDSADSTDSEDTPDTETDDSTESAESGEAETTTPVPATIEPTVEPTLPLIVIDDGRGDSMGYPSDYKKSEVYVETNNIEKNPSDYKSYGGKMDEGMMMGKKMSVYDNTDGNEIEKQLKVFKQALQVHVLEEEDTSTPEVESQCLDVSSGTAEEPSLRMAPQAGQESAPSESQSLEEEEENASAGSSDGSSTSESVSDSTNSASDGTSESTSASASEESDSSQSSEEATATPGAADSDSTESDESQESDSAEEGGQEIATTSDAPVVITPDPVVITA